MNGVVLVEILELMHHDDEMMEMMEAMEAMEVGGMFGSEVIMIMDRAHVVME